MYHIHILINIYSGISTDNRWSLRPLGQSKRGARAAEQHERREENSRADSCKCDGVWHGQRTHAEPCRSTARGCRKPRSSQFLRWPATFGVFDRYMRVRRFFFSCSKVRYFSARRRSCRIKINALGEESRKWCTCDENNHHQTKHMNFEQEENVRKLKWAFDCNRAVAEL
jgi:hypothetical protein